MWLGDLPPVGHRVVVQANPVFSAWKLEGYPAQMWVDSGTSALALALLQSKMWMSHIQDPQVIIPGYCCPDLVAACEFAGVQPVAVDISRGDPGYDLEQLRFALNDSVVAVVAVNFLGVAERLVELRKLLTDANSSASLVEDNAQWFPVSERQMSCESDFVVFSFGRGKPLSLLGGGLLLGRKNFSREIESLACARNGALAKTVFKVRAYNALLSPKAFYFLNRNPLLSLGKTAFRSHEQIYLMDEWRRLMFAANYQAYCARHRQGAWLTQLVNILSEKADKWQCWNWVDSGRNTGQLLRFPLLCPTPDIKNDLLTQLTTKGLGASPLYPREIMSIQGVSGRVVAASELTNAKDFAARFLTLPAHEQVSGFYLKRIIEQLGC